MCVCVCVLVYLLVFISLIVCLSRMNFVAVMLRCDAKRLNMPMG